ncbi:MAG: uL15 family ribosomal protein [Candidatus Parvarchaeota archaeon]|nr:uL15 family ribosomal protein [Candidatus Jingweiarchaeum tengchongense]MCW1297782.1 uL15 family ribosomal protein [Candidatus Jingweiarchaeum tengchongense]MCW1299792.1 uL15 family ribosomal protein [Candidatus Jingweiarchaeum tengchongense]MCW1304237.1 uL15 family ribosomal protein [Candidatus Jingweiarchaeum tengchongense]MCW1305265.1 uL15 family ribosomal protein [Candidatus Jingweiarchaeum tengchongense]
MGRKKSRKKRGYSRRLGQKRRGAGHRGGRGKSGMGKRGEQKVSSAASNTIGKRGFVPILKKHERGINIGFIDEKIESLLEKGIASKDGEYYVIDISKLGYDKLLSGGNVTKKIIVKAKSFSKKAKEKIERAGGKIVGE